MQRIRIVTIAFAALATLSFTTAAYSVMVPPQKTLTKKSSAVAKSGVITPPQKTLNKKSDELAKRGIAAPPQKTLNKKGDELAKRGLMTPPQKSGGISERGIIIVSGKNKNGSDRMLNPQPLPPKASTLSTRASSKDGSDRMLNPQPLPPKASTLSTRAPSTSAMERLGGGQSATVGVAAKGAQAAKAKSEAGVQQQNNQLRGQMLNQQQNKMR